MDRKYSLPGRDASQIRSKTSIPVTFWVWQGEDYRGSWKQKNTAFGKCSNKHVAWLYMRTVNTRTHTQTYKRTHTHAHTHAPTCARTHPHSRRPSE